MINSPVSMSGKIYSLKLKMLRYLFTYSSHKLKKIEINKSIYKFLKWCTFTLKNTTCKLHKIQIDKYPSIFNYLK